MNDFIRQAYVNSDSFDRNSKDWYRIAHGQCEGLAAKYNLSLPVVCAIVAVLSPRTVWEKNLLEAENVITGRPSAALGKNVEKARTILQSGNLESLRGPKVTSFYSNLLNPEGTESVTIDTWAARIALDDWEFNKPVAPALYWKIAAAYREVAAELGLLPSELQAVTWVYVRRLGRFGKAQQTLDI